MSLGTSSLLRPLSGSLLVTEMRLNPAGPDSVSATTTVACTVIYWWFGGQSRFGLALHVTVGGVLSMMIVTVARFESAWPSLARNVKLSVPEKPVSGM